jgi:hypothetical protein
MGKAMRKLRGCDRKTKSANLLTFMMAECIAFYTSEVGIWALVIMQVAWRLQGLSLIRPTAQTFTTGVRSGGITDDGQKWAE